jgi:hypothetical protein
MTTSIATSRGATVTLAAGQDATTIRLELFGALLGGGLCGGVGANLDRVDALRVAAELLRRLNRPSLAHALEGELEVCTPAAERRALAIRVIGSTAEELHHRLTTRAAAVRPQAPVGSDPERIRLNGVAQGLELAADIIGDSIVDGSLKAAVLEPALGGSR